MTLSQKLHEFINNMPFYAKVNKIYILKFQIFIKNTSKIFKWVIHSVIEIIKWDHSYLYHLFVSADLKNLKIFVKTTYLMNSKYIVISNRIICANMGNQIWASIVKILFINRALLSSNSNSGPTEVPQCYYLLTSTEYRENPVIYLVWINFKPLRSVRRRHYHRIY